MKSFRYPLPVLLACLLSGAFAPLLPLRAGLAPEPPLAAGKPLDPFEGDVPDPAFWSHLATARKATEFIGLEVTDRPGHVLGRVADLLVDLSRGRVVCALVATGEAADLGYIPVPASGLFVQGRSVTLVADKAILEDVPRLPLSVTDPRALGKEAVHSFAYFKMKFARADREDLVEVWRSSRLLGRKVRNAAGQTHGTLANLMLDLRSGHVYFAIATVDGGDKNVFAIPPAALTVDRQEPSVLLDADAARIAGGSNSGFFWTDIVDPDWATGVYKLYGQSGGATLAGGPSVAGAAVANAAASASLSTTAQSDAELTKSVQAAWAGARLSASSYQKVMVLASGGVVTLQGRVKTAVIKAQLSAVAEVIAGPGKVVDQIEVGR